MVERFPTHLIMKTLPKVDRNRPYLREAHKFIKREKVPNEEDKLLEYTQKQIDFIDFLPAGILAKHKK